MSKRICYCADPENCRQPVPGYICKAGLNPEPPQHVCQRCDVERRCVDGKTYSFTTAGVVVGECPCYCHMFKWDKQE